jgi:predicted type IV restriction endonuclease
MLKIEYPAYPFKMKEELGKEWIWDDVRKKWVRLTPEEWVRQNFIQYLALVHTYPAVLMAVEKEIWLNDVKKRCDIVVYRNGAPWMIVECKEMGVQLDSAVLRQILTYNMSVAVPYLVITNGLYAAVFSRQGGNLVPLGMLPAWEELQPGNNL